MYSVLPHGHVETLIYSIYYAPRGRQRLFNLASELSQRYLYPDDRLIGIIGAEGSGKSTLIQGLFPGLELTNDDNGVNVTPARIYSFEPDDFFSGHTFHVDIRYELAFRQPPTIVNTIRKVITSGRRVVVEHFDLIYDMLKINAQVLFAIGEEVVVCRPTFFGPFPAGIKSVVDKTIRYRRMAHSAEDITSWILQRDYNFTTRLLHSDVKHGFVINFPEKPDIDIAELENKVKKIINRDLPIRIAGDDLISMGKEKIYCTGTRTHVESTGKIEEFRLLPEYKYDPIIKEYMLVGMVGKRELAQLEDMNKVFSY